MSGKLVTGLGDRFIGLSERTIATIYLALLDDLQIEPSFPQGSLNGLDA